MKQQSIVLRTFLDLIQIDSPSGYEKKVGEYILRYLKNYRIKASFDSYGNVIAKRTGIGKPFLLAAHMDTVEPGKGVKPVIKNGVIRSDGTTVLGADNKAGITAILEAVRYMHEHSLPYRSLEIVFTKEEETGVKGAINLDYSKVRSKEGVLLDACRPLGHIILAAPYIYTLDIHVKGKSAHSGYPEKGVNAIMIASKTIRDLKIGYINKSTTNNIGVIHGGTAFNVVPEEVLVKAEIRSHTSQQIQKQLSLFRNAFRKYAKLYGGSVRFDIEKACHGFSYPKQLPIIQNIRRVNEKLGIAPFYETSRTGSDANVYASKNINVVNISYGGKDMHTTKESIRVQELERLTEFVIEFVKQ